MYACRNDERTGRYVRDMAEKGLEAPSKIKRNVLDPLQWNITKPS